MKYTIKNVKDINVLEYNKFYNNIKIDYSKTDRGIFALKDFEKNEIIEIAPFKICQSKCSCLSNYLFAKDMSYEEENKIEDEKTLVVFGYGSLYNHSSNPNTEHIEVFPESDDITKHYMAFYAIKPIKTGEEIKHSYGEEWWKSKDIKQLGGSNTQYQLKNQRFYLK